MTIPEDDPSVRVLYVASNDKTAGRSGGEAVRLGLRETLETVGGPCAGP